MAPVHLISNLVVLETAKLTMTIDAFANGGNIVHSPKFCPSPNSSDNNQFEFSFYFSPNSTMTTFVWSYKGPQVEATFQCRLSVLDADGEKIDTQEKSWNYKKACREHLSMTYETGDKLSKLFVNGCLKLYCEVGGRRPLDVMIESVLSPIAQFESFGELSKNYETLLQSGKWTDFVVMIGEKQFRVHKNILATRSPVFSAMFEHEESKEVMEGRVVVEDVAVDVFELMILYIYTGRVDQLGEQTVELFAAADRYQLDHLKSICEELLISNLSTESVAGVLLLSDMHNAQQLKAKCTEYIVENIKEVIQTEGWEQLLKSKRIDLVAEMLVIKD